MITVEPRSGLFQIGLDTPEGWVTQFDQNMVILGLMNPVGGFNVLARDLDPVSFLPTSRYYNVAAGLLVMPGGVVSSVGAQADVVAPASATTYLWVNADGSPGSGGALPTAGGFLPLAQVVTSSTAITSITDLRNPCRLVSSPLALGRLALTASGSVPVGTSYVTCDASGGAVTATLPAANLIPGCGVFVRKSETSGNAVTVGAAAGNFDGSSTYSIATKGGHLFVSNGANYEVVF